MAQEQRRFTDAETTYRQALDLYLEFNDRHSAARTYHQLGTVAQDQRLADAIGFYLGAATGWRDTTSTWPPETLVHLKTARGGLGEAEYQQLLAQHVPVDMLAELVSAIDEACE